MATAYEPEEESPTLAAPEEDCEESEVVDDTAGLEKRTEINLKDIEENNGLLRGLNKLTREKKLEQVCNHVNYIRISKYVGWKYCENEWRFYHRKLELSYDVTNSDMREKEMGDLIFYYLTKEVEPDKHACEIIGRLEPFLYTHESWISDCSDWLGFKITFAQFYSRVGNKWAALEQFVYKHKALMLNSRSGRFLRELQGALPYVTLYKMMTDVRDENGQTAMFHLSSHISILSIFENSTDDMYKLLSIQDNNRQTALHVKPEPVLNLLQLFYRTKLRQKTLNLFKIKDKDNKIAVDLIEDDPLKYKLTKFVAQVEQRKYALLLEPKVLIIYTTKGRDGAEEEADTICDAFKLKYTTKFKITRKKDKTKEEMLKLVEEASRSAQSRALIVIIMSHGSVGAIHDSEGKAVTLTSIEDAMCANERSKDLPKILITQCCQVTDDPPSATYTDLSAPSSETDGPTPSKESRTSYVPKNDHFCAIMSCVSGQESTRKVFIPKLAEEIKRSKGQESIEDLALNVRSAMEEEGYKEIPMVMNTLRGKLTLDTPRYSEHALLMEAIYDILGADVHRQ